MGEAMKGVTKAMAQMNRQMNLPALQKIMQEFEIQNEKMEMVSEVMGDAIDDALEGDAEEEETEELVNQVLDEIGVDVNAEVNIYMLWPCNFIKALALLAVHARDNCSNPLIWFLLFQLVKAPSTVVAKPEVVNKVAQVEAAGHGDGGIDDDLQSRLDNLRKM